MTSGPRGAPLGQRLRRVIHRRSPISIARGVRRAVDARRVEHDLARAGRDGRPVVVGPFLDELGFELLYWIPMVRRLLAAHGIEPERVTAFSRGGAGVWYRSLAANTLEILDYAEPDEVRRELLARRAAAGHSKQLRIGALDRKLLKRAGIGDAAVVHPILMYARLRYIWDGLQPLSDLAHYTRYEQLPAPEDPPALPDGYVVVKAYFSACFPRTPANEAYVQGLIDELAARTDVVLLSLELEIDDHEDWFGADRPRVHRIDRGLEPASNLAVQSAVVAGARALVATHGGFSYLGPFHGVPTLAFHANDEFNPVHVGALRAALTSASYDLLHVGDRLDVALDRLAGVEATRT